MEVVSAKFLCFFPEYNKGSYFAATQVCCSSNFHPLLLASIDDSSWQCCEVSCLHYLLTFCWDFHIYIQKDYCRQFSFQYIFCQVLESGLFQLQNELGSIPWSSIFWKILFKIGVIFLNISLKYLLESLSKTSGCRVFWDDFWWQIQHRYGLGSHLLFHVCYWVNCIFSGTY